MRRALHGELLRAYHDLMKHFLRRTFGALVLSVAVSTCGRDVSAPAPVPTPAYAVGQTVTDPSGWLEYTPGNAPLVIVAPHGGMLTPDALPDRTCAACVTVNDANTQDLARLVVAAFLARTGARPHLVINRLDRRKFDANRDLSEATGGTTQLAASWLWLHSAIDSADGQIARTTSRGLLIDLHGHAHDVARLELGYLLTDAELRQSDAVLAGSDAMRRTSIARLATDSRRLSDRGVGLLRGDNSLGTLLSVSGYAAVPSAADVAPLVGQGYFNGGYNTSRHGSVAGGALDAIQIECPFPGVRDTPAARAAFASTLAAAMATYLERHYGWRSPSS